MTTFHPHQFVRNLFTLLILFGLSACQPSLTTAPTASLAPLNDPIEEGIKIWDPSAQNYVVEEYLLSGHADTYAPVTMADAEDLSRNNIEDLAKQDDYTRDVITAQAPYTTRIVVYRPKALKSFSGNVIVESFHPARGGTNVVWRGLNSYFMQQGHAYIAVSHPQTLDAMKTIAPTRYGALSHKNSTQLWGILADTGRLLKSGSIPNVQAKNIVLTGFSFTGVVTSTFANYHHDQTRQQNGKPIFDGYISMANAMFVRPLDVPMIRINNDSDFNVFGGVENRGQITNPSWAYRLYEIGGAAHVTALPNVSGRALPPKAINIEARARPASLPAQTCYDRFPTGSIPNQYPAYYIQEHSFTTLFTHLDNGQALAPSALIETDENGASLRDKFGNAKGGVRLPELDAPLFQHGMGKNRACFLFGYSLPLSMQTKQQAYKTKQDYALRVEKSARLAHSDGYISAQSLQSYLDQIPATKLFE